MPVMGLYCSKEKFAQKIEDTISLLLAAGRQTGKDFGLGPEGLPDPEDSKPAPWAGGRTGRRLGAGSAFLADPFRRQRGGDAADGGSGLGRGIPPCR